MFKNYLKIIIRFLINNKLFSAINILGLVVGVAASLLILEYVEYQLSYDNFHKDKDRVYRVVRDAKEDRFPTTPPALGPQLEAVFPELEKVALLNPSSRTTITYTPNDIGSAPIVAREDGVIHANEELFDVLTVPLLNGEERLDEPFTAMISQTTANKYFGNRINPLGETFVVQDNYGTNSYKITGVFEDVPQNSHIDFNIVFSYATIANARSITFDQGWGRNSFFTYLKLKKGADADALLSKMNAQKDSWFEDGVNVNYEFEPLQSIHLYSGMGTDLKEVGDIKLIRFLIIITLLILIVAWVNYISLSTAQSLKRAKEVGIRKVTGAHRNELIRQFLLESLMINLISIIIAMLLVVIMQPFYNQLTADPLSLSLLFTPRMSISFTITFLLGSFLSGLYPAFVLSGFKPSEVLKGSFKNSRSGILLRKSLVVFQFAISVGLLAGTYTVYKQIEYMRNQDLGMNLEHLLVVRAPKSDSVSLANSDFYQTEMLRYPSITQMAGSSNIPGRGYNWGTKNVRRDGIESELDVLYQIFAMDLNFLDTYEIKLLAGSNFTKENMTGDIRPILINESTLRALDFAAPSEAIDQILSVQHMGRVKVIGVINDYNHVSLKKSIDPLIIQPQTRGYSFYTMRLDAGSNPVSTIKNTLATAKEQYQAYFPGNPFDYFFLDDRFDQQYAGDQQLGKVFTVFSGLAIFIACLGLFGFVTYTAKQRTKEISVRKVLGASEQNLLLLLSKDFMKLVFFGSLIACPIVYFILINWLDSYAYRIQIGLLLFLVPIAIIFFIAIATMSYETIRTARMNPAANLKNE